MSKNTAKNAGIAPKLQFKVKPKMVALVSGASILFFGGVATCFLQNGQMIIGIALITFTVLLVAGMVLELVNAHLLVTEEGIWECDLFKKKKHIPWKNCAAVFKDKRKYTTHIVIAQSARNTRAQVESARNSNLVKDIMIMVPWSWFSKQEKELFLEIVSNSALSEHIKAEFLGNN